MEMLVFDVARIGVSGVRSTASYVWPKSDSDLRLALFRANAFTGQCRLSSIMPVDISLAIERKVSTYYTKDTGPF